MHFKDVVGHKELKQHLIDEIKSEKVSHAQLFLGKPGFGPLPLALAFTQYLFCEQKGENDSCGECASCRKVQKLQHPDLHFSFPTVQAVSKVSDGLISDWRELLGATGYFDLNDWIKKTDPRERKPILGKDESQEIIKKLALRSYEGGYKVMIIWMAEEMNIAAANKLLKIIEEPPAKTLFLLVAASQDRILPTIISRTQLVKVPRISSEDLSLYLKNQRSIVGSTADSVTARADGDLLEALNLIGDHTEQDENRELFIQLMRVCYKKNVLDMMSWAETIAEKSNEFQKVFLLYAIHMFRQSMLRNYTEDVLTRVSDEESAFLDRFSRFITGNNIQDFMATFNDAHYHIERNANSKILFMNLCFQVMRYIHKA